MPQETDEPEEFYDGTREGHKVISRRFGKTGSLKAVRPHPSGAWIYFRSLVARIKYVI